MTRPYRFCKLSPGGNTTILVMEPPPARFEDRARLASSLMDPLHLHAEQVGFVTLPPQHAPGHPRLDMMGGEFCGNAARSLAAVLAMEGLLPGTDNGASAGFIDVSGAPRPLAVRVSGSGATLKAAVEMPIRACGGAVVRLDDATTAVRLDGIIHLLLDQDRVDPPLNLKSAAAALRTTHGLAAEDAVGCIWYGHSTRNTTITPVVWVRETNSTFIETACGSGTIALVQALAHSSRAPLDLDVLQPSGATINARIHYNPDADTFSDAWIDGPVALIARGETFV